MNDFMATVADILDVSLPENSAEDGTGILKLLTGEATKLPNHPSVVNHSMGGQFAIRRGSETDSKTEVQLFDLDGDLRKAKTSHQHPDRWK